MLSRASFVRYLLVAVFSAAVAMSLAAPAANARNGGFNDLIVACFESRDADSEYCRAALEQSPVDAGFFMRLAENLNNPLPKPEPKPDLRSLVKKCAATQDLESEECVRALEESGLSIEEFKEKFAAKLGCIAVRTWDEKDPCAKHEDKKYDEQSYEDKKNREKKYDEAKYKETKYDEAKWNGEMTQSMKDCLDLKAHMSGLTASEMVAKVEKLAAVCSQARFELKLSAHEFWSKHH